MLILVGTVPTAYALNHAVGVTDVQSFAAISTQVAGVLNNYVDPSAVQADPDPELKRFVSTKTYEPGVILALQQMVTDIRNGAHTYGSLGKVPPEMQANIRNQISRDRGCRTLRRSRRGSSRAGRRGGGR
jgi:PiT family inorganic phosphate transporter